MALTYAQLVVQISDWSENTFDAADIDQIIALAEQRIYNAVQLPATRKNVTGTLTASSAYLGTPDDFLAPYSLAVIAADGSYTYLLNKDVNYIRECYPDPTDTGAPVQYAIFDDTSFIVGPTPDAGYSVELHYFAQPESIVTAGTTWLGDNFESVLLNACLYEASVFMKQDKETISVYEDKFNQSMALLKNLGDGKLRQDTYRSGQVRTRVA